MSADMSAETRGAGKSDEPNRRPRPDAPNGVSVTEGICGSGIDSQDRLSEVGSAPFTDVYLNSLGLGGEAVLTSS
jgi:hypothetical protein